MEPLEATLFRVTADDLTSEFTHFNLVIHQSKAKQLAFSFISLLRSPAAPVVPCDPLERSTLRVATVLNSQKLPFHRSFSVWDDSQQQRQVHACRCGFFLLMVSGEVEQIVHLIRWNSYSCFCLLPWLDYTRKGVTHDTCCSWNWVLFRLIVLVVSRPSPTSPHSVPNSSPVLLRNVSRGLGVCSVFVRSVSPRRLVLEVCSFPSPPCAVLAFCPSSVSAFSFLLPFRVDPAPAGCVCV